MKASPLSLSETWFGFTFIYNAGYSAEIRLRVGLLDYLSVGADGEVTAERKIALCCTLFCM